MVEALLLAVTRVTTIANEQVLTNATGFFFERGARLFLVTNRHVVLDEASEHRPDALEIEMHVDPENVAVTWSRSNSTARRSRRRCCTAPSRRRIC